MKTINLAAALVMYFFLAAAFAQPREDKCAPDVYEAVKQHLKINEFAPKQEGGKVVSAACRRWPYKTSQLLAAFAYDAGVEYEKQLLVLILDGKTKKVISSFQQSIFEDAVTEVGEYSLGLDTARYQLSQDVRAFGVRFTSSAPGPSCGDGHWGNELTLFVTKGKKLRPLTTVSLYRQRWLKGCPSAMSHALWEDAALTLSLGEASAKGFYDLVITAKITVNATEEAPQNLKDRIERRTLRYDGKSYQKGKAIPWWLGG